MLTEHHIANLIDQNKRVNFAAEVNWNIEDKKTNESKIIKLSCKCGKSSYIRREILNEFLFAIGTAQDQRKMVPQTISRVHSQEVKLAFKATKDIRKGEEVVMNPIKISIPCSVVDKIGMVNVERGMSELPIIGKHLK